MSELQGMMESVDRCEEVHLNVFSTLFVTKYSQNQEFFIIYNIVAQVINRLILSRNRTDFCR